MKKELFGLSVFVMAAVPVTRACDCCSIFSACNLPAAGEKGFLAGVAEQYTHFGTLQDNGQAVAGDGEYIDSLVSQVFVGYSFNDRFSAQMNMPVIYRAYGSQAMSDYVLGLGDVSLIGNFQLYEHAAGNFTFNWSLLGGIKLPTGDAGKLAVPDGVLPDGIGGHDIAPGSGSVDGVVGSSVSLRWRRAFLSASAQYAVRTRGDFGHRYANDWTWNGGPGAYLWLGKKATVALQIVTSGESKGRDTFYGAADEDSAATAVYLGPQLSYTWGGQLSAQLGADLPVSIENTGLQVVPDYRLHAALTWKF